MPKELFRVNNGRLIKLREWTVNCEGSFDLRTEAGKVKPKALSPTSYSAPNGASMRPNSDFQQRLVSGFKGAKVVVYAVAAGTPLPDDLILVHEHTDHYSLQPAKEMSLPDLNGKITTFLETNSTILKKEQWLQMYPKVTEPSNGIDEGTVTRQFSVISINSSFPTSLLRYNSQQRSNLFDHKNQGSDDVADDAVTVSSDGLVYPAVTKNMPFSNGAIFMPNTFMMQEIIRAAFDQYVDDVEDGKCPESPLVLWIPKGTLLPRDLILLHEHTSQFSLQPSRPMTISDLNNLLDNFYSKHAEVKTARQWLKENPFESAVADDAMVKWMAI
ncbi:hypothetical protein MMC09_005801 [Bachmanniomyces sp. S44760]|nr:hypothetical protein [Bachmanniomyces sp. S44760]